MSSVRHGEPWSGAYPNQHNPEDLPRENRVRFLPPSRCDREMRRAMSTRRRSSGILRAALVAVLAFVLATVYSSNALATAPNSGTTGTAKVDKAVADQLAQSGSATFF